MKKDDDAIEVVRDIYKSATWCKAQDEILFSRWNKEKRTMQGVPIKREAFAQALDDLPENLRGSIGAMLIRDALGSMNNQEMARFVDSMSINSAQHFQFSDAQKAIVDQWYDAQTKTIPEEGPGSVQEKHEGGMSRRNFMKYTVRGVGGFLGAVCLLDFVSGIPRGDEPERLQKTGAGAVASGGVVATSEVLHAKLDAKEQCRYYAAQTVKFLNGQVRKYLIEQHPELGAQESQALQR